MLNTKNRMSNKQNRTLMKNLFALIVTLLLISCKQIRLHSPPSNSNDFDYLEYTIHDFKKGYQNESFTIEEVTRAYLDRIQTLDSKGPQLKSIIQTNPDAIRIAQQLDKELKEGKLRGPLHGIPVVLKDNIDTHDKMFTTAGSRALQNSKPLQDSQVAKSLREAGAVILAKANLSEWANFRGQKSSSGWSGVNGQTKNPYVLTRNPCGSSSGSAVAVSANLTVLAIGTETNGSIVCPSHANGIVGIKPTVGLISRKGIIPISYTQDTAGPMARNLTDAVIALGVLTARDSMDQKTLIKGRVAFNDYTPFLKKNALKGKRIGLYTKPIGNNLQVDTLFQKAKRMIRKAGGIVIPVPTITSQQARTNSFHVMLFEYKEGLNNYFASLGEHATVKNLSDLISFNQKDSIELKYFNQAYLKLALEKEGLTSEAYKQALQNLNRLSREEGIDRVMNKLELDAIIAPTGSPAWSTDWYNGDNFHLGSSSPAAWAGYPNITIPMGNIDGLPVGLSFFGRAWSEPLLIEIAYSFEQLANARIIPTFRKDDYH